MQRRFAILAVLMLAACAPVDFNATATPADRELVFEAFNDMSACLDRVRGDAIRSVTPVTDCQCIRRQFADQMAPWLAKATADQLRGVAYASDAETTRRIAGETERLARASYASCGVRYE